MRAQPTVLGIAAAAAFSNAAYAAPCAKLLPVTYPAAGLSCTVSDKSLAGLVPDSDAVGTELAITRDPVRYTDGPDRTGPATGDSTIFTEVTAIGAGTRYDEIEDAQTFSGDGIKVTPLQATMTANKYIAGVEIFAPATRLNAADDLSVYGPDYLSVKALPKLPKRPPSVLGVGLVTVPSQTQKKSDAPPTSSSTRSLSSEPDRK